MTRVYGPPLRKYGTVERVRRSIEQMGIPKCESVTFASEIDAQAYFSVASVFPHWGFEKNRFGTVYASSTWSIERICLFHDVRSNLEVLTPRTITQEFKAKKRKRGEKLRFLFLACRSDDRRKAAQLAMSTFSAAFDIRSDVEMVVHSTYPSPLAKTDPRINLSGNRMTDEEYVEFLHGFDCLVYPSRSEAVGLTAIEAMATGMPVIHSGATGMSGFSDLSLVCSHYAVPAPDGGEWRELSFDDIVGRMQMVDESYESVMTQAMRDAKSIHKRYGVERGESHAHSNIAADVSLVV